MEFTTKLGPNARFYDALTEPEKERVEKVIKETNDEDSNLTGGHIFTKEVVENEAYQEIDRYLADYKRFRKLSVISLTELDKALAEISNETIAMPSRGNFSIIFLTGRSAYSFL